MKITRAYPRLTVDTSTSAAVAQAGVRGARRDDRGYGPGPGALDALGPWRKPLATHDPAKVILDLAMMLARSAGTRWPKSPCCAGAHAPGRNHAPAPVRRARLTGAPTAHPRPAARPAPRKRRPSRATRAGPSHPHARSRVFIGEEADCALLSGPMKDRG